MNPGKKQEGARGEQGAFSAGPSYSTCFQEENLPALIKEKETHQLKRAMSPTLPQSSSRGPGVPSTTKQEQQGLVGIWRFAGSTRLQNLAVRSVLIFDCVPQGSGKKVCRHTLHNMHGVQLKAYMQAY
eukprot:1158083-Pelagomonas_calceolata.AAC.2